jgi:hypothetical protein
MWRTSPECGVELVPAQPASNQTPPGRSSHRAVGCMRRVSRRVFCRRRCLPRYNPRGSRRNAGTQTRCCRVAARLSRGGMSTAAQRFGVAAASGWIQQESDTCWREPTAAFSVTELTIDRDPGLLIAPPQSRVIRLGILLASAANSTRPPATRPCPKQPPNLRCAMPCATAQVANRESSQLFFGPGFNRLVVREIPVPALCNLHFKLVSRVPSFNGACLHLTRSQRRPSFSVVRDRFYVLTITCSLRFELGHAPGCRLLATVLGLSTSEHVTRC